MAPFDIVDDLEDEVKDEGECNLCDEDALVVVEGIDAAVVWICKGHIWIKFYDDRNII